MKAGKKIIPSELLNILPIRYHFLDEIDDSSDNRNGIVCITENQYYDNTHMICLENYRQTSKLLKINEPE